MKNLTVTQKFLFLIFSALAGIAILTSIVLMQMTKVYEAASYGTTNTRRRRRRKIFGSVPE